MKKHLIFSGILGLFLSHVICQTPLSLSLDVSNHYKLSDPLYGFHTSDFFEHCPCYDPDLPPTGDPLINQCMDYASTMLPQTLRFPSGGTSKLMHLLDGQGYGYDMDEIDCYHDPVALGGLGLMSGPQYDDYVNAVTDQNALPAGTNYLERFIDLNLNIYSFYGYQPKIIYVAKVLETDCYTEDLIEYNLDVLKKLIDDYNVVGVEMGNEVYSNGWESIPGFENAENYLASIKPLMTAIKAEYPSIKIGVVAAPEPNYYLSINPADIITTNKYRNWNTQLRIKSTNITAGYASLVDAWISHVYLHDQAFPSCGDYDNVAATNLGPYDDYIEAASAPGGYNINFITNDPLLQPAFDCALSAFNSFTNSNLTTMFNDLAGGYSYSLGLQKKYWITEWGIEPALPFGNTYIEGDFVMQYLLNMAEISHNLSPATSGQIEYMIKHNFMGAGAWAGAFSQTGVLDPDIATQFFYKRVGFYSFYLMSDIFRQTMDNVKATQIGSPAPSYLKTYFKTLNPVTHDYELYIYYDNQTNTTININFPTYFNFKNGATALPYYFISPTFTKNKIDTRKLYQGVGETHYFKQNNFYNDYEDNILPELGTYEINGIETTTYPVTTTTLPIDAYSFGYIKVKVRLPTWGGFREEQTANTNELNNSISIFPNPASNQAVFTFNGGITSDDNYEIEIFDLVGNFIQRVSLNQNTYSVNLSEFSSGMYIYRFLNNSKIISTGKFVKQ
mgnify:FL=1